MDELDKNVPDDFWRKAFDEAAETPPSRVWDTIERRLDESNGPKVIPLWGSGLASSRPVVWGTGIAAALALLMVGWWVMTTRSANSSVARVKPSPQTGNVAIAPAAPGKPSIPELTEQPSGDMVVSVNKPSKMLERSSGSPASQSYMRSVGKSKETTIAQTAVQPDDNVNSLRIQSAPTATSALRTSPVVNSTAEFAPVTSRMAVTSFRSGRNTVFEGVPANRAETLVFEQLTGKPLRMRSLGLIQRIVWFQSAELPVEAEFTKEKRKKREMWASLSAMPAAFNPSVSIHSAQSTFKTLASANTNQETVNSRSSFSVAYQAGAGVQLNERWSVESGIGYLAGHSTVEAPAQSTASYGLIAGPSADRSIAVNNLYVDALRNSSKATASASAANYDILTTNNAYLSQSRYSGQTQQTLTNDYQYMQVPVQVGYQLRPRKRLSLAVLGGLLTNIFVRNTVGSDVVITAKDGVYRPVSLAATMGARFRYRPSGRWSASVAGLYQPSLGSGTQTESQVQTHPTSTGMSFGVDYHF